MSIDFKKELETAAKNMILEHDPDLLSKMFVKMIVRKVKVSHASILLRNKDGYLLNVSKGSLSKKIFVGLTQIDKENPLIYFFRQHRNKSFLNDNVIIRKNIEKILKKKRHDFYNKNLLNQLLYQMDIFDSNVCIPSYFRDELLAVLLLGKKVNGKDFFREELDFLTALASNLAMAIRNAYLFNELKLELDKKRQLFVRTTIALAAAIEAKDHYTHGHTTRVTNLSLEIAGRLKGEDKKIFNDDFLDDLQTASLLHDIGKIGVPEHILNKRGDLTIGERKRIKEHPSIGVVILKPIKELENSILGVKYHHERYDGLGYPEGLKGNEIPLIASIISVADSFDAMTTDRPYRPALEKERAIGEIRRLSGRQFNPRVTEAFIDLYQET